MTCPLSHRNQSLERVSIFALALCIWAGSAWQSARGQEADKAPPAAARKQSAQDSGEPASKKDGVSDASKAVANEQSQAAAKEPSQAAAKASDTDRSKEPHEAEPREPIERRPYRISFHLACDPSARIDLAQRTLLLHRWQVLVKRFIGPRWAVTIEPDNGPLAAAQVEAIATDEFAGFTEFDKVWIVRVSRSDSSLGLTLSGREYDTASRRLGAFQERRIDSISDAPRALLEFTLDLFTPTAEITGQEGGGALLKVQGGSIIPASPAGAVVTKGMVFIPLRLVSLRDGKLQILRIPFTYLQVKAVEGPVAQCAIISPLRDPLSTRMARPNSLAALGIKPGNTPLKLRFVTKPDQGPAAGYTLTARRVPDGQPREVGMTDRAGRIVLQPGFADGLVILRLLAGNVEPMVELPMMPGESRPDDLPISFDPKPLTVALESQIDSLRDEVVDLVALRARLESRMKARLDGENWDELDATLKEFSRLPPRDGFANRLAKLKDDAAHEQAERKVAILTRTAQAQISDLQSLIDRYLDDETYRAYADALERAMADAGIKEKAKTKNAAAGGALAQKPAAPAKPASPMATPATNPGAPPLATPEPKTKPAVPKSNVPM
jgi:hypothetical protein